MHFQAAIQFRDSFGIPPNSVQFSLLFLLNVEEPSQNNSRPMDATPAIILLAACLLIIDKRYCFWQCGVTWGTGQAGHLIIQASHHALQTLIN